MSTPRTDAACGWPWGHHGRIETADLRWSPDGPFVHSEVARAIERDNFALRAAIFESEEFAKKNGETLVAKIKDLLRAAHKLEDENRRLHVELDAYHNGEQLRVLRAENATLRKEKDRLDWLIIKAPFCVLSTLSSDPVAARLKIDREMEFPTT